MTALQELEYASHRGELLYGYEATAEYLGMTPREVRHQAEANGLPIFTMGRRVAVRVRKLHQWLDDQENQHEEPIRPPVHRRRRRYG